MMMNSEARKRAQQRTSIWSVSTVDQNGRMVTSLATTYEGLLPHMLDTLTGWEMEENMHLHDTADKAVTALVCEGFEVHVDRHEVAL